MRLLKANNNIKFAFHSIDSYSTVRYTVVRYTVIHPAYGTRHHIPQSVGFNSIRLRSPAKGIFGRAISVLSVNEAEDALNAH